MLIQSSSILTIKKKKNGITSSFALEHKHHESWGPILFIFVSQDSVWNIVYSHKYWENPVLKIWTHLGFSDCLLMPAFLKLQKARNKATEI